MTPSATMTLVYILLAMLAIAFVAYPLIRRGGDSAGGAGSEMVRERIDALQDSLRRLLAARDRDEIRGADFANIERRLMVELARLYHRQGVDPAAASEAVAAREPEAPAQAVQHCAHCGGECGSDYHFCPFCGTKQRAA